MKLRLTPEIRFIEDESLEQGSRVRSYYSSSDATKSHLILLFRLSSAFSDAYPRDKHKIFTLLQKLSSFRFEHFCLPLLIPYQDLYLHNVGSFQILIPLSGLIGYHLLLVYVMLRF